MQSKLQQIETHTGSVVGRGQSTPIPLWTRELVEFSPSFLFTLSTPISSWSLVFNHGTVFRILVRGCMHRSVCLGLSMSASCISHCVCLSLHFVYLCSRSTPVCVYGFRCGCILCGVSVSVCLTVCFRVSLCLPISLHLWSAVPGGLSWCVGFVCVCPCRVDPFPLCITPICLWMEADQLFSSLRKMMGLEIQPVHSKGDQSWGFFGRNDVKAETPVLWPSYAKSWLIGKDSDAGRDWGQEEKGTTENEMAGWHHWLDGCEFEWTLGVGDGQGGLACCSSWGQKELDMTERLNWSELNWKYMYAHT